MDWSFEIVDIDGKRIDKVLGTRTPESEPSAAEGADGAA
jgi:hypothetical protein